MSDETRGSLEELDEEERVLSARRLRLHDQIEFLRGSGLTEPYAQERLERLQEDEREVSRRRHELHALIEARRAALSDEGSGGDPT